MARKLTRKQIAAGFGGKRAQSALRGKRSGGSKKAAPAKSAARSRAARKAARTRNKLHRRAWRWVRKHPVATTTAAVGLGVAAVPAAREAVVGTAKRGATAATTLLR